MATIAPLGKYRAFDDNGEPLNGGFLYTYEAGTVTPKATFTTADGDVQNTNPVELDSSGYADVWLGDGGYKFRLTDADGNQIFVVDDIGGTASTAFGENVMEISTNTTVTSVFANTAFIATASLTMSLLDVTTAGEGFYFSIFAQGGDVTIDPDASETINNGATLVMPQGSSAIIICDGDEWWTMCYTGGIVAGQLASNSVATVKIQDDAVTLAKLDGDAAFADKLIGYDDAGDPANISAGSGITIDASVIAAAAGAVLQVVQVTKTDTFTSSSTSYTDITGLSATITPSSATSKILVFVNVQGDATTNNFFMQLVRGATPLFLGDAASSRTRASGQISALGSSGSFISTAALCFLDSPATVSATTYKMQGMVPSSGSFFVNRSQTDTDAATFARVPSSITLVEIKA